MRRSRLDIVYSFLEALEKGAMKQTPLMYKTNLPHDLFTKYLRELEAARLIAQRHAKKTVLYFLTEEGELYLREYRRFLKFSASFGL